MEFTATYAFFDEKGKGAKAGKETRVRVDENGIAVMSKFGDTLTFGLYEVTGIEAKDYQVNISFSSGEKLALYDLGYQYEDCVRELKKLCSEEKFSSKLMDEGLKKGDTEAEFLLRAKNGKETKGECKLRLYETALGITFEDGKISRLRYGDMAEVKPQEEECAFIVTMDAGEAYTFAKMGENLDVFKRVLSKSMNEISENVQECLRALLPTAEAITIRKLVPLMREGRATKRKDIEAVSSELWGQLEARVAESTMKEEYAFLKARAQESRMCIGIKRGLMGDLTKEYLWFLIPLYGTDAKKPGNAVAMESIMVDDEEKEKAGEEGSGLATYFFRITSRGEYPKFKNLEALHAEAEKLLADINVCMRETNFRREPIYLSESKMAEPRYRKYRAAMDSVPELRRLRALFIGRVIHTSPEQWTADVESLLKFNITSKDDGEKWSKGWEKAGEEKTPAAEKKDEGKDKKKTGAAVAAEAKGQTVPIGKGKVAKEKTPKAKAKAVLKVAKKKAKK